MQEGTAASPGGVPIKAGNDVIGAVGVSGAPGGDNDDLRAGRRLLVALPDEFVIGGDTRLRLGLTRSRRRGDPLAFLGKRALPGGVLAAFLLEPLLLLHQPA